MCGVVDKALVQTSEWLWVRIQLWTALFTDKKISGYFSWIPRGMFSKFGISWNQNLDLSKLGIIYKRSLKKTDIVEFFKIPTKTLKKPEMGL